jgi:hypothetical protein
MKTYSGHKVGVVGFVAALLRHSKQSSQSITITAQVKSGDSYATIVTGTLSDVTVETLASRYSVKLSNISTENTPDG